MTDRVFTVLTEKWTAANAVKGNLDVILLLNTELRKSLTLRSLVLLCEACSMRPTAPMLAFALQNSIPGLVGLPMDNPDPGYYIDIAKKFFDPTEISVELKDYLYRNVCNDMQQRHFFPSKTNLDAYMNSYWPCTMDCYVNSQLYTMEPVIYTKKGRDFLKEVMLIWKVHYEQHEPNDPRYPRFINHILNILEHGMILRYRRMSPGWLGLGAWRKPFKFDEHL